MRSEMRSVCRYLGLAGCLGVLMMFGSAVGLAQSGQQGSTGNPNPRGSTRPPAIPTIDGSDPAANNPLAAQQEAARVKAVANDRQKKIVDDTARLLQLANELKAAVDKTTKDQLSLEVIRKAEEIEKLAHDVKQRMKS